MKIVPGSNYPKEKRAKTNNDPERDKRVRGIIEDVKKNGDTAVKKYSKKFDGIAPQKLLVGREEIKAAYEKVSKKELAAIKQAAKNITFFSKQQKKQFTDFKIRRKYGELGQAIIPIQRVGCYVPGGKHPLPSTALMTVIPAKVAGVEEVIVCSPKISPLVIVAADIAGADKIFNAGGAQAIAAMAFGTKEIPRVDKIVGPGNAFVAEAKRQVFGEVGIDFIAGPSEVLIIADDCASPKIIASDLLAQAEHDEMAVANLITFNMGLAKKVLAEIKVQLAQLPTAKVAEKSIVKGKIFLVKNYSQAAELSNRIAPEHLELQLKNLDTILPRLNNYGSLFIGPYSAEVFGDYCSGPNHTLPTAKAARYTGGLGVREYLKTVTWQKITKSGAKSLSKTAAELAQAEGLFAHKKSALARE